MSRRTVHPSTHPLVVPARKKPSTALSRPLAAVRRVVGPVGALVALAVLVGVLVVTAGCSRSGGTVPLAYVASSGDNCVRVIDLASGKTLRRIYTGAGPWRLVPSPDDRRLWVQHWYAGTTAVVDLDDGEVAAVLPFRGPGTFEADGSAFLTFNWPSSDLHRIEQVESDHPQVTSIDSTRVKQAYDMAPGPGGYDLYIAQYDPIGKGPVPRFEAIAALDPRTVDDSVKSEDAEAAHDAGRTEETGETESPAMGHPALYEPRSIGTGRSPRKVVTVPGQPFVLTADSETNGITLINRNADRRVFAVCPAPLDLLLSPDNSRMVVLCWNQDGHHASQVVSFKADFSHRPWPDLTKESETEVTGALVAGAFDPSGKHVLALDRLGGRMVELSVPELQVTRTMEAGDEPLDVAVVEVPAAVRDRLENGESETRRKVREAFERMKKASAGDAGDGAFDTLAWTERVTWLAPPEEGDSGKDGENAEADPIEQTRETLTVLHAPDIVRTEIPEGGVRLAAGGHSLSLDPDGRFWVTPRQDLASEVYSLPNLSVDEAMRAFAGDVPGSPFLRGGLALDVVDEVEESGQRFLVIGARPGDGSPGMDLPPAAVSQLWIDPETGRAAALVEQFPVFEAGGHGSSAPKAAETKFYDYAPVGPGGETGPVMPRRLERVVGGDWVQHVQLQDFHLDPDLPAALFDPAQLGDKQPAPGAIFHGGKVDRQPAANGQPGWAIATENAPDPIQSPLAPFRPYLTSPPTSGPYLPFTADWGVHALPVPLPLQVHNLLDGGIALQYHCPTGCPGLVDALSEIARSHDDVIVAPYPWMEAKLAATAWGRMETFDDPSPDGTGWQEEVERFIAAYAGTSHHQHPPVAPMAGSH